MKKFLNLKIIIPAVVGLLLFGFVGYILFAPSTWWKPFYVRMEMDDSADVGTEATAEPDAAQQAQALSPAQVAVPQGAPMGAQGAVGAVPAAYQQVSHIQQPTGIMYEMDNKVVNLAEPGGLRYLQASIVLELWPLAENFYMLQGEERNLAEDEFIALIDERRPIIDDIVTTTLSSKSFNEIATVEGKQALKDELMAAINNALGYQGVINVYFTSFVVQ